MSRSRIKRPCCQFVQRAVAQFLVKDFDANRAVVSRLPDVTEKASNIEFAFAAEPSVIDRVFVQTPGGGECAVIDLDGEEILQREARDFLVRDAEL